MIRIRGLFFEGLWLHILQILSAPNLASPLVHNLNIVLLVGTWYKFYTLLIKGTNIFLTRIKRPEIVSIISSSSFFRNHVLHVVFIGICISSTFEPSSPLFQFCPWLPSLFFGQATRPASFIHSVSHSSPLMSKIFTTIFDLLSKFLNDDHKILDTQMKTQ